MSKPLQEKPLPPVDGALVTWLREKYPPRAVSYSLGDEPGQYALRCAFEAGRQDVIDRLSHIFTKTTNSVIQPR